MRDLQKNELWLHGPDWFDPESITEDTITSVPPECLEELRAKDKISLTMSVAEKSGVGSLIDIKQFSSCEQLLRTTACVLSFLGKLIRRLNDDDTSSGIEETEIYSHYTRKDLEKAEVMWLQEAQRGLIREEWKFQFQLYTDEQGLWRCRGRLGNADLSFNTRHPILLPRSHAFTELVVRRAHFRVLHSGVKDTLTELQSKFWIPYSKKYLRGIKFCGFAVRLKIANIKSVNYYFYEGRLQIIIINSADRPPSQCQIAKFKSAKC